MRNPLTKTQSEDYGAVERLLDYLNISDQTSSGNHPLPQASGDDYDHVPEDQMWEKASERELELEDSYSDLLRSESGHESIGHGYESYDWRGWSSLDNAEEQDAVRQHRNPLEFEYTERFLAADLRRRVQLSCLPENLYDDTLSSTWLSWGRGGASCPNSSLGSEKLFATLQDHTIKPACFPGMLSFGLLTISENVSEGTPDPLVGTVQADNRLTQSHASHACHFATVGNFEWM